MQKRFPNGTFALEDPVDCSPKDQDQSRECSLQGGNTVGFYESSSWEYSWFAPHDTAHLVTLMGGNVSKFHMPSFLKKLRNCADCQYGRRVLSYRQLSSNDSTTFLMLFTIWLGMSHFSRCVPRPQCVNNHLSYLKCTDTNWISLRERTREHCRCRSKSCLHQL
jgi:hypothetical protein